MTDIDDALDAMAEARQRVLALRQRNDDLVKTLTELRSAAMQFRDAVYRAEPSLRVSNETTNMLSAFLLDAQKLIAKDESSPL